MSRARDLFERIYKEGVKAVEAMVQNEITEDLFLDYKSIATPVGSGKLAESDRKNFAKAISGFGNSDGGVLIWGVDCRQEKGRGDVPRGFEMDLDPARARDAVWFKTLLDNALTGLTLPPHEGVESIALPLRGSREGIVGTHIPAGLSVPFRGVPDGAKDFYIRAGSNFEPVPHAVLAGLFGRRPQPIITGRFRPQRPSIALYKQFNASGEVSFRVDLELMNEGRGMADDLYVIFEIEGHSDLRVLSRIDNWMMNIHNEKKTLVTRPNTLRLPPGSSILAFVLGTRLGHDVPSDLNLRAVCGSPNGPASVCDWFVDAGTLTELSRVMSAGYHNEAEFQEAASPLEHRLRCY